MIIVDAHSDTLTKTFNTGKKLFSNDLNLDFKRMGERGRYVQFFAAFVHPKHFQGHETKRAIELIDKFYQEYKTCNDVITLCCNYNDIMSAISLNKAAALLTIEGGEALQGSLAILRTFYRLGVRSVCLTWNYRNEIADGVGETITAGGLTTFGREVVVEMNRLGMLIDLSHISERGFWDVMSLSQQPVILSHSNAKTICNNKRNLTDEQILAVKKNGGVIGINLYPIFITPQGRLTIYDVIRHIEYIISLVGENHIGIGADYDQDEPVFDEIDGIQFTSKILEELLKMNYSYDIVNKIASGNFLRVIKQVMI